jgi:hypothetical protein
VNKIICIFAFYLKLTDGCVLLNAGRTQKNIVHAAVGSKLESYVSKRKLFVA